MPEYNPEESLLKQRLRRSLCDRATAIRDRRRTVESKWLETRRVWMADRYTRQYLADSNTPYQIPTARRVAEKYIVRLKGMLTPNVKWFETAPIADTDQDTLSNVDNFMWFVLRKRIRSVSNIGMLGRCLMLYGWPILKTSLEVYNDQFWPTQRVVDPFSFYVFPETGTAFDDCEMVFEDFLYSYEKYAAKARRLPWLDDISASDLQAPHWPYHITERLAQSGLSNPTDNIDMVRERVEGDLKRTTLAFVSLTEMWVKREDALYQVYIAWNLKSGPRIVGFIKSQYDEPLYRHAMHRSLPGETYTNSMFEDIVTLEALSNHQMKQFQKAVDFEQGFVATNGQGRKDSWRMKGGAIWEMQDDPRQALQFLQPNITSMNHLRAWQFYLGLMNAMGGAGQLSEGTPGRNMPRAGGASLALIDLSMADIEDGAKLIESEVLTSALGDIYRVSQLIPSSQLMLIPGGKALVADGSQSQILTSTDLKGSYAFDWVGTLQFQEQGQRSQQVMIFINMLMNPEMRGILQQQGYVPDMVELVQQTWRYVLGERGLNKVLVPISTLQQQTMEDAQAAQKKNAPQSNGVPGLTPSQPMPNLPSVTNGFVRQA